MEKNPEDISHQDILNVIKASNQDILDTINVFATHIEAELHSEISGLRQEFKQELHTETGSLKHEINMLKADVNQFKGVINTQMVTKDYLDEKFFKFEGKVGGWLHKEDDKVDALTGFLTEKKVLTKPEAKKIVQMGPFSKI